MNDEIKHGTMQEILKAFNQSRMFEEWFKVLNDTWSEYGLGIMINGNDFYLNIDEEVVYKSTFADAFRDGLAIYKNRQKK